MTRKNLLLLSIISLSALITWVLAPAGSKPACAAGATDQCILRHTVNRPVITGSAENPKSVSVTWQLTNLPPCYAVTGTEVTFTITRNNQPNIVKVVNIAGNAAKAVQDLTFLGSNLPVGQRPNAIVAEVRVTAAATDPRKIWTESNTLAL